MRSAFICGLGSTKLTPEERSFLRASEPAGLILFARNCAEPEQIRRLVDSACDAIGAEDTLVLIDQEGGRVQRLGPPTWRRYPDAERFGRLHERDPDAALNHVFVVARLIAADLIALGINTNCAPVLDLPVAGAHDIIGSRAYGRDFETVVALARAYADGLMRGGVIPVGKHVPGHGRARADSHVSLPVVEAELEELLKTDFEPFRLLADLPAMMTAHVVYEDIDAGAAASISQTVHREIIRGRIGFTGLLMSDDLSMKALEGAMQRRAELVIAAGSDLALHCNGSLPEMEAVASGVPKLEGKVRERCEAAARLIGRCDPFDEDEAVAACAAVLAC